MDLTMTLALRFDYGRTIPWVTASPTAFALSLVPASPSSTPPSRSTAKTSTPLRSRRGQGRPRLVHPHLGQSHRPDPRPINVRPARSTTPSASETLGFAPEIQRPVCRRCRALAHHLKAIDLSSHRRSGRLYHHLAAGVIGGVAIGTTATAGFATPPSPSSP